MTPHNEARPGDYAEAVLLPGDPDRAVWIADTFLESPRLVNSIRGELGFTGLYRGMPVSVQSTGMGRSSFNIYVHELMAFYGVKRAIRVGTCGGLRRSASTWSSSTVAGWIEVEAGMPPRRPNAALLARAIENARTAGIAHHVGAVVSSDTSTTLTLSAALPRPGGGRSSATWSRAASCCRRPVQIPRAVDLHGGRQSDQLRGNRALERQALFTDMCRLALDTLADTRPDRASR